MLEIAQLNSLREDIGPAGFGEVVQLFIAETDEGVARLLEPPTGRDLANELHYLKGAALNLGLSAFSQLCHQGELAANAGNAAGIDLVALAASYRDARDALLSWLHSDEGNQIRISASDSS